MPLMDLKYKAVVTPPPRAARQLTPLDVPSPSSAKTTWVANDLEPDWHAFRKRPLRTRVGRVAPRRLEPLGSPSGPSILGAAILKADEHLLFTKAAILQADEDLHRAQLASQKADAVALDAFDDAQEMLNEFINPTSSRRHSPRSIDEIDLESASQRPAEYPWEGRDEDEEEDVMESPKTRPLYDLRTEALAWMDAANSLTLDAASDFVRDPCD